METLNFKLGENLGAVLQNIANEHLYCDRNPQQAVDTLVGAGVPKKYVVPILKNELYLKTESDTRMGICKREALNDEELSLYHQSNYIWFVKNHLAYYDYKYRDALRKRIMDTFAKECVYTVDLDDKDLLNLFGVSVPFGKISGSIKLTAGDIIRVWREQDKKALTILESCDTQPLFNKRIYEKFMDLNYLKSFVEESEKFLALCKWFQKNFGLTFGKDGVSLHEYNDYTTDYEDFKKLYDLLLLYDVDNLDKLNELFYQSGYNKVADVVVEDIMGGETAMTSHTNKINEEIVKKEIHKNYEEPTRRDIAEPVTFDEYLEAGYIDPYGNVYGMGMNESPLIHVELADALYEKHGVGEYLPAYDKDYNKDYAIDKAGWVRFHLGKIRFLGYDLVACGYALRDKPLTKRQIDRMVEYAERWCDGKLCTDTGGFNDTEFNPKDLYDMPEEKLRNLFEL